MMGIGHRARLLPPETSPRVRGRTGVAAPASAYAELVKVSTSDWSSKARKGSGGTLRPLYGMRDAEARSGLTADRRDPEVARCGIASAAARFRCETFVRDPNRRDVSDEQAERRVRRADERNVAEQIAR